MNHRRACSAFSDRLTGKIIVRFTGNWPALPEKIKLFSLNGRCVCVTLVQGKNSVVQLPSGTSFHGVYCMQADAEDKVYRSYFPVIR
jgi:hypothetical protein